MTVVGYARVSSVNRVRMRRRPNCTPPERRASSSTTATPAGSKIARSGSRAWTIFAPVTCCWCAASTGSAGPSASLIETLHELEDKGVDIKSLTETVIDTTIPMGRAVFGIIAVFAQLRIDTIRENTEVRKSPGPRRGPPHGDERRAD